MNLRDRVHKSMFDEMLQKHMLVFPSVKAVANGRECGFLFFKEDKPNEAIYANFEVINIDPSSWLNGSQGGSTYDLRANIFIHENMLGLRNKSVTFFVKNDETISSYVNTRIPEVLDEIIDDLNSYDDEDMTGFRLTGFLYSKFSEELIKSGFKEKKKGSDVDGYFHEYEKRLLGTKQRSIGKVLSYRAILCLLKKDSTKLRVRCGTNRSFDNVVKDVDSNQREFEIHNPDFKVTEITEFVMEKMKSDLSYMATNLENTAGRMLMERDNLRKLCEEIH